MTDVKGRPAKVRAALPVWRAKDIADDIANVIRAWEAHPAPGIAYPLALYDFGTELARAVEAVEESP